MSNLDTNKNDYLTSLAKGVAGALPFIGSLVSEAIGHLIPNQRFERVIQFLYELENYINQFDARLENLEYNLKQSQGLDLFEEGIIQASRSVSQVRQERLARIVGRALTREKLKYEESKKILNLFRELTDPEILWLVFYSTNPTLNSEFTKQMIEESPDVLKPVSRSLDSSQEEINRGALQDSYKNTLFRLGLITERNRTYQITSLGRLLVRYIEARNNQFD